MTTHVSIIARALLAVVLMIGFYLLALSGSPPDCFTSATRKLLYAHRVTPKLMLICIIAAFTNPLVNPAALR